MKKNGQPQVLRLEFSLCQPDGSGARQVGCCELRLLRKNGRSVNLAAKISMYDAGLRQQVLRQVDWMDLPI